MIVRELITTWGFRINMTPLNRMNQAVNNMKKVVGEIAVTSPIGKFANSIGSMKNVLLGLGGALAGTSAATAGLLESFVHVDGGLLESAQRLGLTVEQLQKYRYAASMSGLANKEFDNTFRFLLRNMDKAIKATKGSQEARNAFYRLGVDIRDSSGRLRSVSDVLPDIAEGMRRIPDGAQRLSISMMLFEEHGARMIPFLLKGKDAIKAQMEAAEELGFIISNNTAVALRDLRNEQLKLAAVMSGVRNAIGAKLIPIFSSLSIKIREVILKNRKTILDSFESIKRAISLMVEPLKILGNIASSIVKTFGGMPNMIILATKALLVLAGVSTISAVGNLGISIIKLIANIKNLGASILLTQLKAMFLPIAIGAGIIALIALIQDFMVFMRKGDSEFEVILKNFGVNADTFRNRVKESFGAVKIEFNKLLEAISPELAELRQALRDRYKQISDDKNKWLKEFQEEWGIKLKPIEIDFTPFINPIRHAIKSMTQLIKGDLKEAKNELFKAFEPIKNIFTSPTLTKSRESDMEELGYLPGANDYYGITDTKKQKNVKTFNVPINKPISIPDSVKDSFLYQLFTGSIKGYDPEKHEFVTESKADRIARMKQIQGSMTVPNRGSGVPSVNNVNISPNITVNVPTNTPPEGVASAVKEGTAEAVLDMLRDAHRHTQYGIVY